MSLPTITAEGETSFEDAEEVLSASLSAIAVQEASTSSSMASSSKSVETENDVSQQPSSEVPAPEKPTCPICFAEIVVCSFSVNCAHAFCSTCIDEWANYRRTCPVCRAELSKVICYDNRGITKIPRRWPRDLPYFENLTEQNVRRLLANHTNLPELLKKFDLIFGQDINKKK